MLQFNCDFFFSVWFLCFIFLFPFSCLHMDYLNIFYNFTLGFPHSSVDKESACNLGDLGLIPGLGRSPGEGIG